MTTATVRWELFRTSVGLKALMAVSGVILTAWVTLHMLGNLLVFAGPEVINRYGAALAGTPLLLLIRLGLTAAFVVHIVGAAILVRRSLAARRTGYRVPVSRRETTVSARSMRWGGLSILLFVAWHVAHIYGVGHARFVAGDVYHNVVHGLASPVPAALYVAATVVFGLHVYHGSWSLFRSLGQTRSMRRATAIFTLALTLGFLAPCVAAVSGLLS